MTAVRLLVVAGFRSYRALFRWNTPSAFIPTLIGLPVLQMVWFVYLGAYIGTMPSSYYVVGNAVIAGSTAALFAPSMSVVGERYSGTLPALLATPASRPLIFAGRVLMPCLIALLSSTVVFVAGSFVTDLGIHPRHVPLLAVCVVVCALSCSCLGLVIGAVGLWYEESTLFANLTMYLMLLVCGVNIPHSALPGWLAAVGDGFPMTHGLAAARALLAGSDRWLPDIGTELGKASVYLAVAILALRLLEVRGRKKGNLEGV
jgi:ABC-2 type transport system permease protein